AFSAGIFHVMTHAFFKALLFLGSGAVIHAMHDEQDIRKMGGLRSELPVTFRTFLVGTIAIAGIPPLAGFFSKDEILWRAFDGGHTLLWLAGLCAAGMTALYMFRLFSLTFDGEKRWDKGVHPHEAPRSMTIPLIVLAILSVVGGFVGIPASLGGGNALEQWLDPIFEQAKEKLALPVHGTEVTEYIVMALSVLVALAGIYLARVWYLRKKDIPGVLVQKAPGAYRTLLNKYYVDEFYDAALVRPAIKGSEKLLWKGVDVSVIDGIVNGVAKMIGGLGSILRLAQSGVAQNYVLVFLAGVVLVLGYLLTR
ncbi:MAG TPA: proton-conducting transporter membrane subunit, partial [Bacteroidota bacterium]|nr:proton-conducting transporter membrane subunit [Bacteroidota bacterium]